MSRATTFREKIIPSLVNKFGRDVQLLKCEMDDSERGEAQFASTVLFAELTVRSDSGTIREYPIIVKYELPNKDVCNWLKLDEQFYNEVYMYETVLPFLDRNHVVRDLFAKFYYGVATLHERPGEDIIILQDLRNDGYRLSTEKVFLDYDHTVLAMKALGRFHALSYAAKQSDPEGFTEKANRLLETRFIDDNIETNYYIYNNTVERAGQCFLDQDKHTDVIKKFKQKLENIKDYFGGLLIADEKMSVICHGDYCRNNVLYKYDDCGRPVAMKMFDIATARHSSPVIDISFFLFLSTTSELRRQHYNDFLSAYHEALRTELPEVVVPTLQEISEEFRKKAVYGVLVCGMWLPFLTSDAEFDPFRCVNLSARSRGEYLTSAGDDTDTRYICDIFSDAVQWKCVL